MNIHYSISLWNYYHYSNQPSLERIIDSVRRLGYGIELWGSWGDDSDLYDEIGRKRLVSALQGMIVSLHTRGGAAADFDKFTRLIDTAAAVKARMVVLHPDDFAADESEGPNPDVAGRVIAYAAKKNVRIALENGTFDFLARTFQLCPTLGFCLDVGHVYLERRTMKEYLTAFGSRLVHLHIQEILPADEASVPHVWADHYIPGTGGIPHDDWRLVAALLREKNYDGIGVFEIHPRNPLQTAFLGTRFFEGFLAEGRNGK